MKKNVFSYITHNFNQHLTKTALIYKDSHITYEELMRDTNSIHIQLLEYGLKKGDIVGLLVPNSPMYIFLFLALAKIGVTIVPLDVNASLVWNNQIINQCEVDVLIAYEKDLPLYFDLTNQIKRFISFAHFVMSALKLTTGRGFSYPPAAESGAESEIDKTDLAAVFFPSGTTKDIPRGASSSHQRLISVSEMQIDMFHWRDRPNNVYAVPLSIISPICMVGYCIPSLRLGHKFVILESNCDVNEFISVIRTEGVNTIGLRPSLLKEVLNTNCRQLLRSLKDCFITGEYLEKELLKQALAEWDCNIYNFYGSTETFAISFTSNDDPIDIRLRTVGRICPGVNLKIVNADNHILNPSNVGEICVKSPYIMNDYFKLPAETRRVLDSKGFIHTGDIGCLEDGYLKILGRMSNLITKGNQQFFAEYIEEKMKLNEQIRQCIVVSPKLKDLSLILCWIFSDADKPLDYDSLINHCKSHFQDYMIPDYFIFSDFNNIPKTTNGKVNRKQIEIMSASLLKVNVSESPLIQGNNITLKKVGKHL